MQTQTYYPLTVEQTQVHEQAIGLSEQFRKIEYGFVQVLRRVDELKIYVPFGKSSLFAYATDILRLEKGMAYALITVARKSREVSALDQALRDHVIPISKLSRIVSTIDNQNAHKWIEFAATHSREELDYELAKENPKSQTRDQMKPISEDLVEIKVTIARETFEKLKRAESLEVQKQKPIKWGSVLDSALERYLDKNDPVRKAKRAMVRKSKLLHARVETSEPKGNEVPQNQEEAHKIKKCPGEARNIRIPLTAEQKHAVFLRDGGKCTHISLEDKRCNSDKWLDVHHIVEISKGGTNDIENLTTLCSFHHDLVHQLSLPIEGQITWLRSPQTPYRVQ